MNRNFGLDLLRAISIWLVLLYHVGLDSSWLMPNGLGGYGVEVFFVLSGFLIGDILLKDLNKENTLKAIWKFWIRRWYRILPLYYLMVLIKYFFIGPDIGKNIIYYLLFLQNHIYGIGFYSVTWSLVIEEWFYIIAPLYIWLCIKLSEKSASNLIGYFFGFVLFIVLFRTFMVIGFDKNFNAIYGSVPLRLDSIFIGVIAAYLKFSNNKLITKLQSQSNFILVLFFIGIFVLFTGWAFKNEIETLKTIYLCVGTSFFSILIASIIPFIENINVDFWNRKALFIRKFITLTSLLTYGIYLIHPIFLYSLREDIFIFKNHILNLAGMIFLSYVSAYLVYRFYERPILIFRDRITNKNALSSKYLIG